jgi:hypothetical protein
MNIGWRYYFKFDYHINKNQNHSLYNPKKENGAII